MKILHINTYDKGGAATACRRIHLGLLEQGVDSKVLYLKKTKDIKGTYQFPQPKKSIPERILEKIKQKFFPKQDPIAKFQDQIEIFSYPDSKYDITQHPLYKEADIIQLNWVSTFLDETTFFAKNTKPVIWRMADLYACGGGNHYEKNFPFTELEPLIKHNKNARKKALIGANLTMVCISNWVKEKAEASDIIGSFPKTIIHNGVDLSVFKPYDKYWSRTVFNLSPEKKIVLLGADMLKNERKGIDLAQEALKQIQGTRDDVQVVTFGKGEPWSPEVISLGEIQDERLLAILYSAADLFIMSSIEEAFGQVTIEALACGLPVVSFPTGGSIDIIKEEENGILAKDFTADELAKALTKALSKSFDSKVITSDVQERFDIKNKVLEYRKLYESILQSNS